MSLESVTADYLKSLSGVGGLYTLAALARAGLLDAYYGGIIALYEAQTGGLMYTGAAAGSFAVTLGVPVVTMVGVWVALGSGYAQARTQAKNENFRSGFSQGFVMAILGWKWAHVVPRFRRDYLSINKFDEVMNSIRVNSYHSGLKTGYLAGVVLPPETRKEYVSKIRRAGRVRGPKSWSRDGDVARNQQISYVIDMATTALRHQIIRTEWARVFIPRCLLVRIQVCALQQRIKHLHGLLDGAIRFVTAGTCFQYDSQPNRVLRQLQTECDVLLVLGMSGVSHFQVRSGFVFGVTAAPGCLEQSCQQVTRLQFQEGRLLTVRPRRRQLIKNLQCLAKWFFRLPVFAQPVAELANPDERVSQPQLRSLIRDLLLG
jgi:hypothetical protein